MREEQSSFFLKRMTDCQSVANCGFLVFLAFPGRFVVPVVGRLRPLPRYSTLRPCRLDDSQGQCGDGRCRMWPASPRHSQRLLCRAVCYTHSRPPAGSRVVPVSFPCLLRMSSIVLISSLEFVMTGEADLYDTEGRQIPNG